MEVLVRPVPASVAGLAGEEVLFGLATDDDAGLPVAHGHDAAISIDKMLTGEDIRERLAPSERNISRASSSTVRIPVSAFT